MSKKIAVLMRDRQSEALRMAIGLTLADDKVDVFALDRKMEGTDQNLANAEIALEMDMELFSNCRENEDFQYLPTDQLARKLLEYDHILPY